MSQTGHNSELTDRERRALRMHHIRKLVAHQEKIDEVNKERKRLRGVAKADGFKLSEIDQGMRLMQMEDPSIFVDEIRELYGLAQDFGIVSGAGQDDLFADRRPIDERAEEEGLAAGLAGKNCEAPYGEDSKPGQAWITGWHEGQRQMREDLQSAMEKRNAERGDGGAPEHIVGSDGIPNPDDEEWDQADPANSNKSPPEAAE